MRRVSRRRKIGLAEGTGLVTGALTADGQTHGVASSSVCSHVFKALDVVLQFPPQVVLDCEGLEFGGEVVDCAVAQDAQLGGVVNRQTSHEALRDLRADAVKALEGALDEARFRKVDAEDELHTGGSASALRQYAPKTGTYNHGD